MMITVTVQTELVFTLISPPSLCRHYFGQGQPMASEVERRLAEVFVDDVLSPAQVESMCAEHEAEEGMIEALAARIAAIVSGH